MVQSDHGIVREVYYTEILLPVTKGLLEEGQHNERSQGEALPYCQEENKGTKQRIW